VRKITILAAFSTALLCGAQPVIVPRPSPLLAIFLNFDSRPSSTFIKNMENELSAILSPIDLNVRWYMADQNPAPEAWVRVVFLSFHGSCTYRAPEPSAPETDRMELGETAASGGVVLPYSDMNCDRLRAFIAGEEPVRSGEEQRMGIAMGRVVAHELYHVLLQTGEHSEKGIAKAVFTPAALLRASFGFEAGELDRIRQKYALLPRPHNGGRGSSSFSNRPVLRRPLSPPTETFLAPFRKPN
jgi:hypothetical protein